MTLRNYTNTSVQTTLVSGIDASETSITVADATGYPTAPFAIVIDPDSATAEEVLLVTVKVGAVFTVTRAFDGTTGKAHSAGATVIHAAIAGDFTDLQTADTNHAALTTSAHGGIIADTDPRLTDSRTPTAHDIGGALHTGALTDALHGTRGGGTQHANVVAAGAAGFMTGTDKTKLDGIASGATANTGTVTSVDLTVPSILSVPGSPVTTSGTLAITLATEAANTTFAGPTTGAAATPTFRALVAADLPNTTVTPASYGSTATVATFTVDAQGRLTAAASAGIAIGASAITSGILSGAQGGTGIATYANGDLIYASGVSSLSRLADVPAGSFLRSGGITVAPAWSAITLPNAATTGDLWYASASNVISALGGAATGNALISGGTTTAPSWGKIALTTHVSGVLPVANGGNGVAATPAFAAHKNGTNQTGLTLNTFVKITWSTELFDTHSDFASDKFTPTIAGKYLLALTVTFQGAASRSGRLLASIYKNGSEHKRSESQAANDAANDYATTVLVALVEANGSTDNFEAYIYAAVSGAGTITVDGGLATTHWSGIWVGE